MTFGADSKETLTEGGQQGKNLQIRDGDQREVPSTDLRLNVGRDNARWKRIRERRKTGSTKRKGTSTSHCIAN